MKKIKMTLSQQAVDIFKEIGVDPFNYGPAYNGESVGLDLYNTGPEIKLPGRNKWAAFGEPAIMIPTGVRVVLPIGTVGLIKERGSVTKTGLVARAGVIDPGYTGEIFVNLINVGEKDTILPPGAKLPVQLVTLQCMHEYETVSYSEYLNLTQDSTRAQGSLGSSDKKTRE